MHRHHMVGIAAGQIQVMQHHDDGFAVLAIERAQQIEHVNLVGQIQKRGRFIEQHHLGILRQRHGYPHPLALAAGKRIHRAVRQCLGAGLHQRLMHHPFIFR